MEGELSSVRETIIVSMHLEVEDKRTVSQSLYTSIHSRSFSERSVTELYVHETKEHITNVIITDLYIISILDY